MYICAPKLLKFDIFYLNEENNDYDIEEDMLIILFTIINFAVLILYTK